MSEVRIPWPKNDARAAAVEHAARRAGHSTWYDRPSPEDRLRVLASWRGTELDATELPFDMFCHEQPGYYPRVDALKLIIENRSGTQGPYETPIVLAPELEDLEGIEDIRIVTVSNHGLELEEVVNLMHDSIFNPFGTLNEEQFRILARAHAAEQVLETPEERVLEHQHLIQGIVDRHTRWIRPRTGRTIVVLTEEEVKVQFEPDAVSGDEGWFEVECDAGSVLVHNGYRSGIQIPNGVGDGLHRIWIGTSEDEESWGRTLARIRIGLAGAWMSRCDTRFEPTYRLAPGIWTVRAHLRDKGVLGFEPNGVLEADPPLVVRAPNRGWEVAVTERRQDLEFCVHGATSEIVSRTRAGEETRHHASGNGPTIFQARNDGMAGFELAETPERR